jgi:hypothetical protein
MYHRERCDLKQAAGPRKYRGVKTRRYCREQQHSLHCSCATYLDSMEVQVRFEHWLRSRHGWIAPVASNSGLISEPSLMLCDSLQPQLQSLSAVGRGGSGARISWGKFSTSPLSSTPSHPTRGIPADQAWLLLAQKPSTSPGTTDDGSTACGLGQATCQDGSGSDSRGDVWGREPAPAAAAAATAGQAEALPFW